MRRGKAQSLTCFSVRSLKFEEGKDLVSRTGGTQPLTTSPLQRVSVLGRSHCEV